MRLCLLIAALTVIGCDDADDGPGGSASCEDAVLIAQCPPGSNPQLGSVAEASCGGAAGTISSDASGAATGNCVGSSQCVVACQWASPCLCGVASVTREGIDCQPCDIERGCGNGVCDPGEDPQICAIDCGARCAPGESRCGNEGGRQSCNLQGVWEDLDCPDGRICALGVQGAECVLDVVGPNPEPESGMGPDPEPEPNACWEFGPATAPSDGTYLTPGDCRGLAILGPARGILSDDGRHTLRFEGRGLRRYVAGAASPIDEFPGAIETCAPEDFRALGEALRPFRDEEEPARSACALTALQTFCANQMGDLEAIRGALVDCAALPSQHQGPEDFGLDPQTWPLEFFIKHAPSPEGRYEIFNWKTYPRARDDAWNLAVFDYRDEALEVLPLPVGYVPDTGHFSFAFDQRTLVGSVRSENANEYAIAIWDLQTGEVRLRFPELVGYGDKFQVSPDGRFLIFEDAFYDLETEEVFARFLCAADASGPPVLRRTGHWYNGWLLGDADQDLNRVRLSGGGIYSPDGTTIIKAVQNAIEFWDVATNERIQVIAVDEQFWSVRPPEAIMPMGDCRHLIVGDYLMGPAP